MKQVISILLLQSFLLQSCHAPDKLEGAEYVEYINSESSGLKKTVSAGECEFTFQYRPLQYVAYSELNGSDSNNKATLEKRVKDLGKTVWFNIYIKMNNATVNPLKSNVSGLDEYNTRLNYFLMSASDNLSLSYGNGNNMSRIAYHFENNFGLTPMDVMVVGFEIPDNEPREDMVIEYDDKLFHTGPVKVKFNKSDIIKTPELLF